MDALAPTRSLRVTHFVALKAKHRILAHRQRDKASRCYAMASNESIALRESLPPEVPEQEPRRDPRVIPNINRRDSTRWDSNMKKAFVLIGSAILQLPIWGRLYPISRLHLRSRVQASP
jgi:hypothetical protein